MGRKLTKNEKTLLILLLIAAAAAAYYYLFWENMSRKITEDQTAIANNQPIFDEYNREINELGDLQEQLNAIKNQPTNRDKFYTSDENQEVYMDFLQKLIADNNLMLDSVIFSKERVELPAAAVPTPSPAGQNSGVLATPAPVKAAVSASDTLSAPYFNVTTAAMTFAVDFDTPENLLNALDTIQTYGKMTVADDLQLSIIMGVPPGQIQMAGNTPGITAGLIQSIKMYKCVANIKFVSLIQPVQAAPTPGAPSAAAAGTSSAVATGADYPTGTPLPEHIVEVPVATSNP